MISCLPSNNDNALAVQIRYTAKKETAPVVKDAVLEQVSQIQILASKNKRELMIKYKNVDAFAISIFILGIVLLSGCANNSRKSTAAVSSPSSTYSEPEKVTMVDATPKLDIITPALDPTFMQYMKTDGSEYELASKLSAHDPMLQPVQAIRVRDRLFVVSPPNNDAAFSAKINESHLMWQEQDLSEIGTKRATKRETINQALGGAALIGLGVLSTIVDGDTGWCRTSLPRHSLSNCGREF